MGVEICFSIGLYCKYETITIIIILIIESGNMDTLSANLENTDDLVPSLQVSC